MENQLTNRLSILLITVLILAACTRSEDPAESANQRFILSMDWNNSHSYSKISVPSDNYSLLVMGDSHVGGTNNLDRFFNIATSMNAAAVVMAGDLTTGKAGDYDKFQQHLPLQELLPQFLIAGNHDLWGDGCNEFFTRFGTSTYYFTIDTPVATDLFICLETAGGTLGNMQLDWLRDILQNERSNYRHCIVFTHNHLIRSRHSEVSNPPIEEMQILLGLFSNYNIDLVVTAHDHKYDTVEFGNTTYVIIDPLKDGLSNAGYFEIKSRNGKPGFERIKLN
jgi:predicted phosphodiesterase